MLDTDGVPITTEPPAAEAIESAPDTSPLTPSWTVAENVGSAEAFPVSTEPVGPTVSGVTADVPSPSNMECAVGLATPSPPLATPRGPALEEIAPAELFNKTPAVPNAGIETVPPLEIDSASVELLFTSK